MKILMVASEVHPFAKSGGLADVVNALSVRLSALGHDVRIVLPFYHFINVSKTEGPEVEISVPGGYGTEKIFVYRSTLPKSEVPVYLLDHPAFSDRNGIYGDSKTPEYTDNAKRFALFCKSAFSICENIDWIPDILHSHDWPAALTNIYLHANKDRGPFRSCAGVLTIHNLGYQGIYSKHDIHHTLLDWDLLSISQTISANRINFLQTGIEYADIITTVSPTYAEEIQKPEYGFSLDELLSKRKNDLYGILNGMDYDEWNPENDPLIPYHFNENNMSTKAHIKRYLQEKNGLVERVDVPLFVIVSRLAEQKGFAELAGPRFGSLYLICRDMDVQFVILGTGEKWCEDELRSLSNRLDNLAVNIEFNNRTAHIMEAAGDFFLMPSKYEPCGLNQMYSLRYGTLPIVSRTGGLTDTIKPYDPETGEGTGFYISELSPQGIYSTVKEVVEIWDRNKDHIKSMRIRAMQERFSWEKSAKEYLTIYEKAEQKRASIPSG